MLNGYTSTYIGTRLFLHLCVPTHQNPPPTKTLTPKPQSQGGGSDEGLFKQVQIGLKQPYFVIASRNSCTLFNVYLINYLLQTIPRPAPREKRPPKIKSRKYRFLKVAPAYPPPHPAPTHAHCCNFNICQNNMLEPMTT